MKFKPNQIIDNQRDWHALISEVKKLEESGSKQWIYRAMRKWPENNDTNKSSCTQEPTQNGRTAEKPTVINITSSFDDAWERTSPEIQSKRKNENRGLYESWMLMDFKREAHHFLNNLPKPDDFLEWMALARHYEMPSRLVDFSYSFYVAAYFALSERGRHPNGEGNWDKDEDGCILAVNLDWLKDDVEKRLSKGWRKKINISDKKASFHEPVVFQWFAFKSSRKYVVPVNPFRRNTRLARQHGLFLCPGNIEYTFEKNLEETIRKERNKQSVIRLVRLSAGIRSEAIRELGKMDIGLHTLYGDLAGWAESRRDLVHKDITDKRFKKELKRAIGPDPLF